VINGGLGTCHVHKCNHVESTRFPLELGRFCRNRHM
jgi:hypothetical protein